MSDIFTNGYYFFLMMGLVELIGKSDPYEICHKFCTKHNISNINTISWCRRHGGIYKKYNRREEFFTKWKEHPQDAKNDTHDHIVCCIANDRPFSDHDDEFVSLNGTTASTFASHLYTAHRHQETLIQLFLLSTIYF